MFCLIQITVTDDIVCQRKRQRLMTMEDHMETDDSRLVVEERSHHGDRVCDPSTSMSKNVNVNKGILQLATTYSTAYIFLTQSAALEQRRLQYLAQIC